MPWPGDVSLGDKQVDVLVTWPHTVLIRNSVCPWLQAYAATDASHERIYRHTSQATGWAWSWEESMLGVDRPRPVLGHPRAGHSCSLAGPGRGEEPGEGLA